MTNEILLDEIKFGNRRGEDFPQPINPQADYNELEKQFTEKGWIINGLNPPSLVKLAIIDLAKGNNKCEHSMIAFFFMSSSLL